MAAKKPKTPPVYLRPNEVEECKRDKAQLESKLKSHDPNLNRASIQKAIERVDRRMEQAPPDFNAEQRDKASKRIAELEVKLQEGLLSQEDMRRNPPGAVAQNIRYLKRNKLNIQEWKALNLALHKGMASDEAEDLCNLDTLRRPTSMSPMDGAQIPKVREFFRMESAYDTGHHASASFEEIFGSGDPEKDALRKEIDELRAQMLAEKAAAAPLIDKPLAVQVQAAQNANQNQRAPQNQQRR